MQSKSSNSAYLMALVCVVAIPNIALSFAFDGLVHDDSAFLHWTSIEAHNSWLGPAQFLYSYREDIIFHLALNVSPQVARFFIVVVYLCGSAVLLFKVLQKFFAARIEVAFFASAMPFLVMPLWQIPVGMNVSYVAGDVLASLIATWLVCDFLRSRALSALESFRFVLIYLLMAETQLSSIITAPIVLVIAMTYGPTSILRRSFASIFMLATLASVFVQEVSASRKATVSFEEFLANLGRLISQCLSIVKPAIDLPGWPVFAGILFLVGTTFLLVRAVKSIFEGMPQPYRRMIEGTPWLCAAAVILVGCLWSLIPYSLTLKSIDPHVMTRYYYIWQFFFWIAFAIGFTLVLNVTRNRILLFFNSNSSNGIPSTFCTMLVVSVVICFSTAKATNFHSKMKETNEFVYSFKRSLRASYDVGSKSTEQTLILITQGGETNVPHLTNYLANTGYLNYLIRPKHVNFNRFADSSTCGTHFTGLSIEVWGNYLVDGFSMDKSLAVFEYNSVSEELRLQDYLIDVKPNVKGDKVFLIYDVSGHIPMLVDTFNNSMLTVGYLNRNNIPLSNVAYGKAVSENCSE